MAEMIGQLVQIHAQDGQKDTWFQEEARAERLVGLIRIIYVIVWLAATIPTLPDHPPSSDVANVGVGTVWLIFALAYYVYLRRSPYHPWQKYFSITADILFNSAILFFYHYDMGYSTTLKAPPYMNYFLVGALAAFRFDERLALYAGLLAITVYLGLFGAMIITQPVEFGTPLELFTTPKINLVYQFYRLAYLIMFTFLTWVLVQNAKRLVSLRVTETERAAAEQAERERTQQVLERYFTPEIAHYVADNPPEMGGRLQEATVLIADLRGFTGMSERLGPQESVALLNRLFARLVEIVFAHGGTLDKFLGDGILVVFGTPEPRVDDALRAVQAARKMVQTVAALSDDQSLRLGVGIDTGEVIFGNVGSPQRMELTVIGDAVNTASRLEALNKVYGTQIILSDGTYDRVSASLEARPLPETEIRGKAAPMKLFAVEAG